MNYECRDDCPRRGKIITVPKESGYYGDFSLKMHTMCGDYHDGKCLYEAVREYHEGRNDEHN